MLPRTGLLFASLVCIHANLLSTSRYGTATGQWSLSAISVASAFLPSRKDAFQALSRSSLILWDSPPVAIAVNSTLSDDSPSCVSILSDHRVSPRVWLESHEDGAYTVVRCDYHGGDQNFYSVWGYEFHLERLNESYALFLHARDEYSDNRSHKDIQFALNETKSLTNSVLNEAKKMLIASHQKHPYFRVVLMLTVLWHPRQDGNGIEVKGHACLGMRDNSVPPAIPFGSYNPDPITVVLAPENIPNRMPHPAAKLSGWCRERRSLEEKYYNLNDTIAEVVLTRDGSRLLEGLTTNVFVLYPGHVLRTSGNHVLPGYARHLILQSNWTIDTTTPILIDEADTWMQVFVTSAIRIIVPVNRILVPALDRESCVQELWRMNDDVQEEQSLVWRSLFKLILAQHDEKKAKH